MHLNVTRVYSTRGCWNKIAMVCQMTIWSAFCKKIYAFRNTNSVSWYPHVISWCPIMFERNPEIIIMTTRVTFSLKVNQVRDTYLRTQVTQLSCVINFVWIEAITTEFRSGRIKTYTIYFIPMSYYGSSEEFIMQWKHACLPRTTEKSHKIVGQF